MNPELKTPTSFRICLRPEAFREVVLTDHQEVRRSLDA